MERILPQGDTDLLQHPIAQGLLASTIPARVAFIASDGTPRVVPTWFQWTGSEIVTPTFVAAPHIHRPAARIRALKQRPAVCITIDTEQFPPRALTLRGDVTVTEVNGVADEYAQAARRYLGDGAEQYLASIESPDTVMARIALAPEWVGLVDFESRFPAALGGVSA